MHTIDFSNEYGHQLNLNKIFRNNLSFNLSYAFALHHRNGHEDENLFNINIYNNLEVLESIYPYKQYFIEFSNWSKNDIFYYRLVFMLFLFVYIFLILEDIVFGVVGFLW